MKPMTTHLRPLDLAIVASYLIAITLFGLRFRERKTAKPGGGIAAAKSDRSLQSYFLANNTIPWWAIALSIVSAETSTLTIISIPGVAFAGDFGFLQVVIGYMLGRIVVAALFLPRYFAGEMLTAYQLIDQRFGHVLHKVTAGLFLLTRAAAEGVRVFAVSIVVGIAIGTRDVLSIAIISALTLLYTFEGGMAAVIWTDVVQMAIYILGTLVAVWSLGHHIPGGWSTIHTVAGAAGKFHMLDFAFNLTTTYTFWAGVLGGTFLTMASHGTDQLMVQRMLAARNLRESRLALLSSGVVIFIQFTLFLLIGAGLYVFAQSSGGPFIAGPHPAMSGVTSTASSWIQGLSPDRIFPTFIVRELPIGIAGLLVAAILAAAMSNLSAALNSLSSTTVVDFYMHLRPNADSRERNLIAKSSTVLWAIVLFAIAIYSLSVGGKGHVVEIGLSIASVAYGCLLGVFLLGTLTKFATEVGTALGMVCGFALNLWLWQGTFPKTLWHGATKLSDCTFNGNIEPTYCPPPPSITIPHIAFTWYVLIGAIVTFALGSLFSLLFRKQSRRTTTAATASLLLLFCLSFPQGICVSAAAQQPGGPFIAPAPGAMSGEPQPPDFTPITTLLDTATAAHQLPGAVVLIGHNNKVVFEQAYGNRKLAGEPGLDGKPSPAEPMTEDTIFDMASLTKDLATATAIMQLYEAGNITSFDDPLEKYLPAFNESHDPTRSKVTLRMLLTHTSGAAPDVDLRDAWGLAAPDRAEGLHRALTTPLKDKPGTTFTYSDINFILLGDLIETLSGQREDDYVTEHIFLPLGMAETRYLPIDKVCGPHKIVGAAIVWTPSPPGRIGMVCPRTLWGTGILERVAPTTHDDESKSNPAANPHFDMLTRGTVHDPTTRRMGGVAGHAGVFSTAHDVSLYASALLEKLLHNTGPFPLKQSTLQLMTTPEQPGHTPNQIAAANAAEQSAISAGDKPTLPGLAPHYPAIPGQNLRGYGWDIDTAFSKPRGAIFPIGSFGHTGFTGTSLWMDPASDTYVILLANAIHPRGGTPISNLRGQVATAAALALRLEQPSGLKGTGFSPSVPSPPQAGASALEGATTPDPDALHRRLSDAEAARRKATVAELKKDYSKWLDQDVRGPICQDPTPNTVPTPNGWTCLANTLTGIDVLEQTHFAALKDVHKIALFTNQSGLDAQGRRTVDVLLSLIPYPLSLSLLFSPEHGLTTNLDTVQIANSTDPTTHLPIISLYGAHPSDRRPTHDQLKDLDAVVIDLQDAGVHFWTYEAAVGYFLEAASTEQTQYHHDLEIILLDRPNPIGGVAMEGPISDPGLESYVNYMPLPVRHGLTLGELARYIVATKHLATHLSVVPMQHWSRTEYFAQTGLPWTNPSPNLRSPEAAILYPALGLIETTNLSVGRGTAQPFSFFGAGLAPTKPSNSTATGGLTDSTSPTTPGGPFIAGPHPAMSGEPQPSTPKAWFQATEVANYLTARNIPGVTFTPTSEAIAETADHYPFHGQTIEAVRVTLTDPKVADTPELGIEILAALHHLYPTQFNLARAMPLVCNKATMDALTRGDAPRDIAATWQPALTAFRTATAPYLLYP
jgi:SSS family transporter